MVSGCIALENSYKTIAEAVYWTIALH